MAKRDRDTEIWKTAFYKSLPPLYKCFWDYINDDCDNAGVWMVDWKVASTRIGRKVNPEIAAQLLSERVQVFANGEKWYIKTFISEKLGFSDLNPAHKFQNQILQLIARHKINEIKGYPDTLTVSVNGQEKGMIIEGQEKEGKGGMGGLDRDLTDALDQGTLDTYFTQFNHKGVNVEQEAEAFRAKVRTTPNHYQAHGCEGLRMAFFKHLQNVRPKNGGLSPEERQRQVNAKIDAA